MKTLVITLLFVLCVSAASGQKVQVGADPAIDVSKYKTYAWATGTPLTNPLVNQTIVDAVDRALAMKGLTKVETNAEVTVVSFAATESDLHITYPSWAPGLNSIATGIGGSAQAWPITKGTLVVDILEATTKNSVWRGTATETLKQGPTGNMAKDAKSVEKVIKKAVEKMFKQFPRPSRS